MILVDVKTLWENDGTAKLETNDQATDQMRSNFHYSMTTTGGFSIHSAGAVPATDWLTLELRSIDYLQLVFRGKLLSYSDDGLTNCTTSWCRPYAVGAPAKIGLVDGIPNLDKVVYPILTTDTWYMHAGLCVQTNQLAEQGVQQAGGVEMQYGLYHADSDDEPLANDEVQWSCWICNRTTNKINPAISENMVLPHPPRISGTEYVKLLMDFFNVFTGSVTYIEEMFYEGALYALLYRDGYAADPYERGIGTAAKR